MINEGDTSQKVEESNMSVYESLMFAIAFATLILLILKFNQKK